jgi:hypothetical protein
MRHHRLESFRTTQPGTIVFPGESSRSVVLPLRGGTTQNDTRHSFPERLRTSQNDRTTRALLPAPLVRRPRRLAASTGSPRSPGCPTRGPRPSAKRPDGRWLLDGPDDGCGCAIRRLALETPSDSESAPGRSHVAHEVRP